MCGIVALLLANEDSWVSLSSLSSLNWEDRGSRVCLHFLGIRVFGILKVYRVLWVNCIARFLMF